MTTAFADLVQSNVWSEKVKLPCVPQHANPHIYTAYAVRVLEGVGESEAIDATAIREISYPPFLEACSLALGLISTFPNYTMVSSHDDAYGAAFLRAWFSSQCFHRLSNRNGVYSITDDPTGDNFYRFGFVEPAMRAWASEVDTDVKVGILATVTYVAALFFHLAFTKAGDTSGHLLLWLSFPIMKKKSRFCATAIDYWSETWSKRGFTPKSIFSRNYLTECPWFAKYARDDWN